MQGPENQNTEWTLVTKEMGYRPKKTMNRRSNQTNQNRQTRKQKILYNFFHYEEMPDELYTIAQAELYRRKLATSRRHQRQKQPERQPQLLKDEDKEKVQAALVNFFREGYEANVSHGEPASDETILNYINMVLTTYGIKISGGFVLKNMGMFQGNTGSSSIDIDIYLPHIQSKNPKEKKETTIKIHTLLQELFNVDKVYGKPVYKYFKVTPRGKSQKHAFFTKNGIFSVTKYSKGGYAEMDLVQADSNSTPIQIIQRFDLSFCQNWYDGENLWSMDRDAVYKEEDGLLEDSYVPLYLEKNPVTRKRIAKYMKRGFGVKYRDPETGVFRTITEQNVANA